MTFRPEEAHWFEIYIPRDQTVNAVESLSRTGLVQLEIDPEHKVSVDLDNLRSEDMPGSIDMGKMVNAINQVGALDVYFSKTNQYAPQHEYRILWHSFLEPMPEHIDIVVPEAIEFCRKITK